MQSKSMLLKDPKIKKMFEEFKKQQGKGKRMKGAGLWEDFLDVLKKSKVISNVGGVLVPLATGALGGTIGTALGGPAGTVTGSAAGAAAGKSAIDYLKSLGYGRMRGGDSRLVINPNGTRLGQRGKIKGGSCGCGRKFKGGAMTYSINGTYSQVPGTLPGSAIGIQKGGGGMAFNTVSSEFGNIRV